ncbi:MAG: LAGLIDADG family homing endonuclease [archaeon]
MTIKNKQFFSKIGRAGVKIRWERFHSKTKIPLSLTKEKASLHAYLCGDGNISIRKERKNKSIHYEIRFFPDNVLMLKNICNCLFRCYGLRPKNIKKIGSMYHVRINNKLVCKDFLKMGKYGTYDWSIPREIIRKFERAWLACFFDCEAHVSKRGAIQVKSVNGKGLKSVKGILSGLGIISALNGPYSQTTGSNYYVLSISAKAALFRYSKEVGFNHSEKIKNLNSILNLRPDGTMAMRK